MFLLCFSRVHCIIFTNNNNNNKPLAWDVMAVCTAADSYVAATAREAGASAARAAELKIAKHFRFGRQVILPANCGAVAWSTQ